VLPGNYLSIEDVTTLSILQVLQVIQWQRLQSTCSVCTICALGLPGYLTKEDVAFTIKSNVLSIVDNDCIIISVGVSHGVLHPGESNLWDLCRDFLHMIKLYKPTLLQKPKLHLLLHLPTSMEDFGPAACFNTERLY